MPSPEVTRQLIRSEVPEFYQPAAYVDRIVYQDRFSKRPILAADLDPATINQAAQRLLTGANLDWIISGTNAANANSTLDGNGGILLSTGSLDNDQIVLSPAPAINSVAQSPFGTVDWEPEDSLIFETTIQLGAITSIEVLIGLSLTNAFNITTDNDYAKLRFSTEGTTSTTNWTQATGVGGVDAEVDTGIAAVANRSIRLGIETTASRQAQFLINGLRVGTPVTLTAGVDLIPVLGIQNLSAASRGFAVRDLTLSKAKVSYTA